MKSNSMTQSWLAGLSAGLLFFFSFLVMQMGGTLKVDWMSEFNLTTTEFSVLASMFLYGNTLTLIPAGIILDRYSIRKVLLIVIPISIASTVLFACTHSLYLAGFCRFIQGCCNSFCFLTCVLVTAQWFPADWRGFVMGTLITIGMMGGVVAQAPLAMLVHSLGWREAILGVAVIGIIGLLSLSMFIFDNRNFEEIAVPSMHEEFMQFCNAFQNKTTWSYGVYICLMNLPVMVIAGLWGNTYLQEVHHMTATEAPFVNSLIMIGTIVGSPIIGWFSDKIEKRQVVMAYSAVAAFFVLLVIMYGHVQHMRALSVLFFMLGFVTSAQVVGYPVISERNPIELQAKAAGIASIAIMGGAAVAENITGWLLEMHHRFYGHDSIVIQFSQRDFQYAFTLMLLGFIVSFFICWNDVKDEVGVKPVALGASG